MADTTFTPGVVITSAWLNDVNDHTYNDTPVSPATTVHAASKISVDDAGSRITGTTVEAALQEAVYLTTTDTLQNKTINLSSNTVIGTTAQFNSALSDNDFATLAGAETLTNKTINLSSNSLSGTTAQFNSALSDDDFVTATNTVTLTNKTALAAANNLEARSGPSTSPFSLRNKIINGVFSIDQRNNGASQTITAGGALAYTVDRWYAYCTGANVTGQRVAGSAQAQYRYRFTGAASVTKIGFAQRIEAANSYDLNGKTATLSVDLANSVLTTVTWTAWYANTADTFGSLASPTRTQIATGSFTVNGTVARYSTQIAVPAAATTGIEIEFSVGAQTSGTWTIGDVQLEEGTINTPIERRPVTVELDLCQRYYQVIRTASGNDSSANEPCYRAQNFHTTMRAAPTGVESVVTQANSAAPGPTFTTNSMYYTYLPAGTFNYRVADWALTAEL